MIQQVKVFDNVTSDNESDCNSFLKEITDSAVVSVTPLYNTILGGVIYVVVYYHQ
jgi:hypothetical protein